MKRMILVVLLIFVVFSGGVVLIINLSRDTDKPISKTNYIENTKESNITIVNDESKSNKVIDTLKDKDDYKNKSENTTKNTQSITTTTTKNKENNKTKEKQTTTKVETTKENIWDKLGMTEDDYKNKPVYKWETVDFSVEKYGSEKNTREACLQYGDTYEPYRIKEESFNCDSVFSLSGKYLGEMFYTEKLN